MEFSEKLAELLQSAEDEDIFDKAVAGYLLPDGSSHIVTLNTPEDTVFDIASLTKVCPTSTLALSYILEGTLSIDAKVIDYIPELNTNYRDEIYVSHLLTHSLDYRIPMKTLRTLSPEGILNALYTYQFAAAPGTVFNYGNPASVLLGILLQRLTGKTLQEQGNERFFTPLGMTRSGYNPLTRVPKSEIAATELCEFRHREIQGEVHDESAWVFEKDLRIAEFYAKRKKCAGVFLRLQHIENNFKVTTEKNLKRIEELNAKCPPKSKEEYFKIEKPKDMEETSKEGRSGENDE